MERSLSDNKNTLTPERSLLSDETLMGLRRMKEVTREKKGAHNIQATNKDVVKAMKDAHSKYKRRKQEEEEEKLRKEKQEQAEREAEEKEKRRIEKATNQKEKLEKKEESLQNDEDKTKEDIKVAETLLKEAQGSLDAAIEASDMLRIKTAREMIVTATKKLELANVHAAEQSKTRRMIGIKHKGAIEKLLLSKKPKK